MPNGDVNPCEMLRHIKLGNIYNNSIKEILNSGEERNWIDIYDKEENLKCKMCKWKQYCINCKGLSYLENGILESSTEFACDIAEIQYKLYDPGKLGDEN